MDEDIEGSGRQTPVAIIGTACRTPAWRTLTGQRTGYPVAATASATAAGVAAGLSAVTTSAVSGNPAYTCRTAPRSIDVP